MASSGPEIILPEGRKIYLLTVRLDYPTYLAIQEIKKALGAKRVSRVVRMCIWYTLLLNDPKLTVFKALKPEAINKIKEGVDMPLSEAIKPMNELFKELEYIR